ncbi:MAG TPA: fasciclin domain-containing protein, partial [Caldilineaceae bacterium]|nr:fasciclin domain-containing protein [Caldilineaceae bacterium]
EEEAAPEGAKGAPGALPDTGGETGLSDLVDTAASNEQLSTLVAAIQAAGLAEALRSEGPFTVFAPTNDAFAALPEGTLDELLADPAGRLSQILLYHVVSGEVLAGDMTDGLAVDTLQGGSVTFAVDGDQIMVNDANIIAADVEATNGVIHVIDRVLTPEEVEIAAEATPAPAEEATPEAAEEATPEAAEEATPAPEEEATPAAEEEAVEATPAAEEEAAATPPAEEEAAPEGAKGAPGALPDTGGEQTGAVAAIAVVALVVLALAGSVIFTRRRTA